MGMAPDVALEGGEGRGNRLERMNGAATDAIADPEHGQANVSANVEHRRPVGEFDAEHLVDPLVEDLVVGDPGVLGAERRDAPPVRKHHAAKPLRCRRRHRITRVTNHATPPFGTTGRRTGTTPATLPAASSVAPRRSSSHR